MAGLYGSLVKDPNYGFRLIFTVIVGCFALSSIILWRGQLLFAAEYQEMPITNKEATVKKHNRGIQEQMRGKIIKNYELEN